LGLIVDRIRIVDRKWKRFTSSWYTTSHITAKRAKRESPQFKLPIEIVKQAGDLTHTVIENKRHKVINLDQPRGMLETKW